MATLSKSSVEWSIEHLSRQYDTDIFPRIFEYSAIAHSSDEVATWVAKQDICQWKPGAWRQCLVPKQLYGFRVATQLDPLDQLFYTALCLEIGDELEASRVSVGERIAFASRFARDDNDYSLFDKTSHYGAFRSRCLELSQDFEFTAITDIADFYPRINLHRIENAVESGAPSFPTHVKAITRLIKLWQQKSSHGLPVGNKPSRLLAEAVIDDVDRVLRAEGITFVRFVDDYRIFAHTREEAYSALARLANALFDMHQLSLQKQKTDIMPADRFQREILRTEHQKEFDGLDDRFWDILEKIGIFDPYAEVDYDALDEDVQAEINSLNLQGMLTEQLKSEFPDLQMTSFLVNRLRTLNCSEVAWPLVKALDKIYPVFGAVVKYLDRVRSSLSPEDKEGIGRHLLEQLDGSVLGCLEFNRMLVMSLFAGSSDWGCADDLVKHLSLVQDPWFGRALIIALGRYGQAYWARDNKKSVPNLPPWEKRALLYAGSCLPKDEMKNWYGALKPTLGRLETWVAVWAAHNRIAD